MRLQIRQKLSSLGPIFAFDAPSPTTSWRLGSAVALKQRVESELPHVQKPHRGPGLLGALGISACQARAQAVGGGVAQDHQNVVLLCHRNLHHVRC